MENLHMSCKTGNQMSSHVCSRLAAGRTCIARTLRNRLHSCVCTGNCTMAGRGRTTHPPSVALAASQLSGGSTYIAAGGQSSTPISRLFQKKIMAAESIDTNCMTLTRYF